MGGNREWPLYLSWCAAGLIGYTLRACLYALALSMSHKATFTILKNIRGKILDKLPKLPLGTILDTSSGKLKQIIVDQVENMETPLAHLLPEMTGNLFGPVCILIYLFVLDWRMALLSLVSIPVGMLFMMLVMIGYGEKYAGSVRTAQAMNSTIVEYIGGIEVIKAFNQGKNSYAKYADKVLANAAYYYNWMKSCQFPTSLAKAVMPTTLITVLPAGWLLYRSGSLSVETFITTLILSLGIAGPLLAAMNFMDSLAKIGTIVGTVDEILNGEEQHHSERPVKLEGMDIALENVSFGYHEGQEILHNVSLDIPAGTMTAFVGPSGSGKSTIAKLIAGFWDVTSGHITLGGHDLKDIPLTQLYDQVAFVSQDNYLFDESIRDNIAFGIDADRIDDKRIWEVLEEAQLKSFVEELPEGLETTIGDRGVRISGGQRQRLGIARALYHNPEILVFDEATSALDGDTESAVMEAVNSFHGKKTMVIIAHRLNTIAKCDVIYKVENGKIAQTNLEE